MPTTTPRTALQLRSLVKPSGELELSLASVPIPEPAPDEVLVRIEAAPINPSDLGLLFGAADMRSATLAGTADRPVITAPIPDAAMQSMAGRLGASMPVGNEGAGTVVAAGSSAAAQALMGRRVAMLGGAMYAQFRCVSADQCLLLPPDASAADGASSFVNPLTALGMVETMRREGHTALVHTAAASNLGQMLNRLCLHDGVGLLRSMGAAHVCVMGSASFMADLTDALATTGATLAFDATGGGTLAGQILTAMEAALNKTAREYSRYGSTTHKQVYIYGGLDTGPTEFNRSFGMSWGMGGWLIFPFLQRLEPAAVQALKQRVASELKTTFKSHYAKEVSLVQALHLDMIAAYGKRATGEKYLINPNPGTGDAPATNP